MKRLFLGVILLWVIVSVSQGGVTVPLSGGGVSSGGSVPEADTLQTTYTRGNIIILNGTTITEAVCIGDGITASDTLYCVYVDSSGRANTVICDGERANCAPPKKKISTVSTSPYAIAETDCGSHIRAASGAAEINLMADMTGCLICVREVAAVTLTVDPNSTDAWDVVSYNVENGTALAPSNGEAIVLAAVSGNAFCMIGTSSSSITLLPGTLGTVTEATP